MLDLIRTGRVQPEKIITHRFSGIEKIPDAMRLYMNLDRSLIKAVIYNE
jgi:threonine dehydrogenase-like Zn-dependent dehydrogenase